MKRYYPLIYILLLVAICYSSCKTQQVQVIEMKNLFSRYNSEKKLSASIKFDTLQKQNAQGLRFTIVLKNDSDSSVSIENILNRMAFDLTLDHSSAALLPGDNLYSHGGPKRPENTEFLNFTGLKVNGALSNLDQITKDSYSLQAHSIYEISVAIPKVLNAATKISLPIGNYHIYIGISLFSLDSKIRYKSMISGPIPIRYSK